MLFQQGHNPESSERRNQRRALLPDITPPLDDAHRGGIGGRPADAEFLRLVDGASTDDFLGFIDGSVPGPPPFTTEGGVAALGPGRTSVVLDDIAPGDYLIASFSPNPAADMAPQFLTGHRVEFTVG